MIDEKKLIEEIIPILNEHGDMYLTGRIIGLIDSQPRTDYSQRSKVYTQGYSDGFVDAKEQLKTDWIPFEEKEADEDEKEAYGCEYMLCCKLPDEDEEILVTYANGNVGEDIFLRDGYECYLDSGAEFITEAIAWMPKPQPYKKEGEYSG